LKHRRQEESGLSSELTWLPAHQIRQLVVHKELSPVEVTRHFLERIEDDNDTLHAFQAVDHKGALEHAARAEEAVTSGSELGPLHGVPISVKQYIPVAGFLHRDSNGLVSGPVEQDAVAVARLRDAGAIVLGTNTAMGITEAELNPYDRQLEARNPWDKGRVTGWSSSGGASAVAAGLSPIALANDGGGSTRLPAAGAGVVGVHPTPGTVPEVNFREPKLPALTVSTGPICRSVVDAAVALQVLAGPDGRDFTCTKVAPADFLEGIDRGVVGVRLAWTDDFGFAGLYAQEGSTKVVTAIREAASKFRDAGATVELADDICEDFWEPYVTTNYLFQIAMDVPRPSQERWEDALEARRRTWAAFRSVLSHYDLLLCPTMQMLAPTLAEWEKAWLHEAESYPHGTFAPSYTCYTHMFNWLQMPAMSVPCGFVDGLPIGLQIVGLPGNEAMVLRAARAYELCFSSTSHRPPSP
jgi:aspartyl-tRNA(Asn)/glutamyl-tRNA(Gln) amidotransferase subunit A